MNKEMKLIFILEFFQYPESIFFFEVMGLQGFQLLLD